MIKLFVKDTNGALFALVILTNIIFLGFSQTYLSGGGLFLSFLAEVAFLKFNKWSGVGILNDRMGAIWVLLKSAIYTTGINDSFGMLPFVFAELLLQLFFNAGYFLGFFATAVPMQNSQSTGKLEKLAKMLIRVNRHKEERYFRPLVYALLTSAYVLHLGGGLLGILLIFMLCYIAWIYAGLLKSLVYLRSPQYRKDLVRHMAQHDPEILVYVSGAKGSTYQLSQWIPVLEAINKNVTVIARELFWINDLHDSPLHTVYARGIADLEKFIGPATRVCLYPANAFKNTQMMRQTQLKHIFINHGESDKVVNQTRFIKAYDKLYLAGPLARDRLEQSGISLAGQEIAYIGRPQTSIFIRASEQKTKKILYAPTWEGFDRHSDYSSVSTAFSIVQSITNHTPFACIFKPHPLTGTVRSKLLNELQKINAFLSQHDGKYIRSGNILEYMNDSDLMITDISSVMNDYLCTGRPYIVTNPRGANEDDFRHQYPTARGGHILNNVDNLPGMIKKILDTDPMKDARSELRIRSLGDASSSAIERFEAELELDCQALLNLG